MVVFKCQEDSFLKEYVSNIVSCSPTKFETVIDGKKTKLNGYEVICENTIIFPEGGGQPYDLGYLNEKKVYQVLRKGDKAIHYLTEALNPGDVVKQSIDWDRRFDHMQQHSGQHLISAIMEREFNFTTLSWWMSQDESYIEFDTPTITEKEIREAEQICNQLIREHVNVTVQVYKEDTPEEILKDTRSVKGLPDDHVGDIRTITIEGVESNMCCGTHVSNLSQLQAIKLLHVEKSKRKNNCLLYFLIGNRVLRRLDESLNRERKITAIINNGPSQHVDVIDKLSKSSKAAHKNLQTLLKELAVMDAEKIKNVSPKPKYYCLHRKEAEPDFMNNIIREVGGTDIFLFLSVGDDKGVGNILLYGEENCITDLGKQICDLLSGKGAGKGNRFQAKVTNLGNKGKVEELLEKYFK